MANRLRAPDGSLPSAESSLYDVPLGFEAVVLRGFLVNTHASTIVTVQLYKQNGASGTKRRITPVDLVLVPGDRFLVAGFTLQEEGQIRGVASTASVVDYSFSIHEEEEA